MIRHDNPGGPDIFTAPFALVEGMSSMRHLAQQACFVQTGLLVEPRELLYIEESLKPERAFCFWFRGEWLDGDIVQATPNGVGESTQAVWVSASEMENITSVRPLVVQYDYWQRKAAGIDTQGPRYLIL